ncbi:oxidoreductase [Rhodococcus sp. WMMA185]|uniref:NAD(P)/FAD-dependent oxidoreductase n=1 Tax=Rhodococcus sp. WMMA185 TaxID=679318 RepID=UPI0008783ECF|nr:FAD-dependent oxidoreductase [Rhodococcus sp. WMMA185]AOW92394.1 oxidoreductase [Rhodococcus sp. WMMA185]
MHERPDAVVVGAGVIGSSIALQLAKRGNNVLVVDKAGGPGYGSTSASSAIIRFNYSTFDGVVTAWESSRCWADWRSYLGLDQDVAVARFHRTGMVFLDVDTVPRDHTIKLYQDVNIPYEEWDSAELVQRIPGIDPGRYFPPKPVHSEEFFAEATATLGALYTPDAGFVDDPQLAAANLAQAAADHGAAFKYRATIVEIDQSPDGLWHLHLDDGTIIDSSVVVNAAGPWSGALNTMADVGADFTVAVAPLRQEVHHVSAPTGFDTGGRPGPCIADLDVGIYARPDTRGGFLIGGTEPACDPLEWIDDPDTADLNRTADRFESQVMRAARRFPDLTVPAQPRGIAGVYDVASDWTPIYDKTDRDGFYVAIGTSGNQFKNAPLAGEFLAEIITAVEAGHDHDRDPVQYIGRTTRLTVDLGSFSRKRQLNAESSGTVLG